MKVKKIDITAWPVMEYNYKCNVVNVAEKYS